MIVFKNYFKILWKYKTSILFYVGIIILFLAFSGSTNNSIQTFTTTKPDVVVINNDTDNKITNNFINYLKNNTKIREDISTDENKLADALFYRDTSAVIYIYNGYGADYLNNIEKKLDVRYTNDASSSYVDMLLQRYFKAADMTNNIEKNEDKIIDIINNSLKENSSVSIQNKLDTSSLEKASYFYTFSSYSMLAISIFVIATVMSRFSDKKIYRRNYISSKGISSITKELYLGNLIFALLTWLLVIVLSIIMVGKIMFTANGLLLMLNSLIFMICALSIGFLVGTIISDIQAINVVVNVLGLGSSFLCGAFVPTSYLPSYVVLVSHVLPTYWYIANNNLIETLENINFSSLVPYFTNMVIVLIFAVVIFLVTLFYQSHHITSE